MLRFAAITMGMILLPSPVLAQDDEPFVPGLNAAESDQGFQLLMKTVVFVASATDYHEEHGVFTENAYVLQPFLGRFEILVRVESSANTALSAGRAFWVATESDIEATLLELHMPEDESGQLLTIVAKRPGVPVECAVRIWKAHRGDPPSPLTGWQLQAWCTNIRNDRTVRTEEMVGFFVPMLKSSRPKS